jgi:hypothetical protein
MTRYYYTCPIEAAYMEIHHGFKYEPANEPPRGGWLGLMAGRFIYAECSNEALKLYVTKETEHLLVPRLGGVILDDDNEPRIASKVNDKYVFWSEDEDYGYCLITDARTIYRDNKPFIMPEREEV